MSELDGQSALVTGASGAIGGAVALALARRGVRLLLSGRSRERLEAIARRTRQAGSDSRMTAGDLTDEEALRSLAATGLDELGGVDLLIHALGAYAAGPVAATTAAELDRQLLVNLRVPFELTRLLLASLRERRGQVVFVNSSAALRPRATVGAYAASKAALAAFATSLREELNPDGVRVLSVFPGRTASAMQEEVHRLEGRAYEPERLLQPAEVAAMIVRALELPRTAEVTDILLRPAHPP